MVSAQTIDALLSMFWHLERLHDGYPDPVEAALDVLQPIGRRLVAANAASVAARYSDEYRAESVALLYPVFRPVPIPELTSDRVRTLVYGRALGIVNSFAYQCEEICDWESSDVYRWCEAMKRDIGALNAEHEWAKVGGYSLNIHEGIGWDADSVARDKVFNPEHIELIQDRFGRVGARA